MDTIEFYLSSILGGLSASFTAFIVFDATDSYLMAAEAFFAVLFLLLSIIFVVLGERETLESKLRILLADSERRRIEETKAALEKVD